MIGQGPPRSPTCTKEQRSDVCRGCCVVTRLEHSRVVREAGVQDGRASQARLRKYNYPLDHEGPAHIFKKGVMKCHQVGVSVGLRGKE